MFLCFFNSTVWLNFFPQLTDSFSGCFSVLRKGCFACRNEVSAGTVSCSGVW